MSLPGLWSRWDSPITNATNTVQRSIEKILADALDTPTPVYFDKRISPVEPSFYECIYSLPNSVDTVVERCYKDIGCCASGCCTNTDWQAKYGWAVALICLFSLVVIIAVLCWSAVWLCERRKDQRQKQELYKYGTSSAKSSQMSLAYPIQNGYHFGTGPFQSPPLNYPTKY
ncbi:unnamed protein product [Caenorhabditis bovis]|uniref:CX domain-containing protein n=1 Tax=Caenorhabditis bovis TaxID=2654633 RepID=A0A8S1EGU6_9PELO|nr:unnamed protein product [Caenorhabditis bovis]